MTVNFNISLSNSQKEVYDLVHNDDYKYYTVVFSRQSGKSTLMMVLCIEWLFGKGNSIAYVCRTRLLGETLYGEIVKVIPKDKLTKTNGSSLCIETVTGSKLQFFSAEQGNALRGQTFTHMINDEFSFHKQEQPDGTKLWYDIMSPTLKVRGKKCLFVGTPLGKNNILYEMYQRGLSDDFPDYVSILKNIYDDGFITPEEIEKTKRDIPEISFRQEYLCEWLEDGLTFFQGYSDCFDIDKWTGDKCWIGIDFSSDGQDSTICAKISDNGSVEIFEAKGTLDMKYRQIADYIDKNNPVAVYAENNGVGSPMIGEVKKLVRHRSKIYEWTTTNSSKEEIVSDLAVAIANRKVHFIKSDDKLYNELGNFVVTVSKTRKLTFAARGSGHDDTVLATCIALRCMEDLKYQGINKNKFILTNAKRFI